MSEAERKAMMAHYFKRNEEMKKLAENDDDDFEFGVGESEGSIKTAIARFLRWYPIPRGWTWFVNLFMFLCVN